MPIYFNAMTKVRKILLCLILFFSVSVLSGCGNLITDTGDYISATVGKPDKVDSISTEKYAYSCLTDAEKKVYDVMLSAFLNHDEKATVSAIPDDDLEKVFYAILSDYGGIFWVNGYEFRKYEATDSNIILFPTYTKTKEEEDMYQSQIDSVVEPLVNEIPSTASDFDKSKFVYDYLINNVSYDASSSENQNIISVFLNGASVCQGIADAANYLFTQLSIPSVIIRGTANGQSHAWNMVMLDGSWYFFDATWGNSEYLDPELTGGIRYVNYAYLNTTSEEMATTHTINMQIDIPECSATMDNYYVASGLYFTAFEPSAMGNVFKNAYESGAKSASIKCSSPEIYNQMKKYFLDDFHISEYISGISEIKYNERTDIFVLTMYF